MIDDSIAVIVAGGESTRMGRDKATLRLGDRTLLDRVMAVVQPLFPEVFVSVRERREDIPWPQVCDLEIGAGPLAGLHAGLQKAAERSIPWAFIVAADMPFLRAESIDYLAGQRQGWQAVVPVVDGYEQVLAGFYSVEALVAVRRVLEGGGKRSVRAALELMRANRVDAHVLREYDPAGSFLDLDTPHDLAAAERRIECQQQANSTEGKWLT